MGPSLDPHPTTPASSFVVENPLPSCSTFRDPRDYIWVHPDQPGSSLHLQILKPHLPSAFGHEYIHRLESISDSTDMNLSKVQEMVKDREACWTAVHGPQSQAPNLATEQQTVAHHTFRGLGCGIFFGGG